MANPFVSDVNALERHVLINDIGSMHYCKSCLNKITSEKQNKLTEKHRAKTQITSLGFSPPSPFSMVLEAPPRRPVMAMRDAWKEA